MHKNAFLAIVEEYNEKSQRHGAPHVRINMNEKHSWEDTLRLYNQSINDSCASVPKGAKGFIQRGWRRFGRNSESFESWLKLLPTESQYLSVLCGGLQLIIGVSFSKHISIEGSVSALRTELMVPYRPRKGCLIYEKVF